MTVLKPIHRGATFVPNVTDKLLVLLLIPSRPNLLSARQDAPGTLKFGDH